MYSRTLNLKRMRGYTRFSVLIDVRESQVPAQLLANVIEESRNDTSQLVISLDKYQSSAYLVKRLSLQDIYATRKRDIGVT